jgi:hypothetical protein
MALDTQASLFSRRLWEPEWIGVEMRAQLCVDPWRGSLEVWRYSTDGTLEAPFSEEMHRGDAASTVLAGLRHFAGHLALVTGWPELQARCLSMDVDARRWRNR